MLGPFSDGAIAALDAATLDVYEALLSENDHDIYSWVSGQVPAPEAYADLVSTLRAHAEAQYTPQDR